MTIYLVRHASAGSRGSHADDTARPLDERGHQQASAIRESLGAAPIDAIYSSRALRCVETVEPLAAAVGLDVQRHPSLFEGSPAHQTLTLIQATIEDLKNAVFCSHGDVIPDVLDLLVHGGLDLGKGGGCAKGSVWTLHTDGAALTTGTYASMKK
jgi:phosphohistidine phosphatase SixA